MLIKKIVCETDAANAEAFAQAQSRWGALSCVKWLRQTGRRLAEKRRRPVHRRDHQRLGEQTGL